MRASTRARSRCIWDAGPTAIRRTRMATTGWRAAACRSRCSATIRRSPSPDRAPHDRLDLDLGALARDDHPQPAAPPVCLALGLDRDLVKRLVGAVGIVVIQDQPLRPRSARDVDRARHGRVTPPRLEVAVEALAIAGAR